MTLKDKCFIALLYLSIVFIGCSRSTNNQDDASRPDAMFFNVKDYGVKGDGVTDDTNAIQALINEVVQSGGGTIYFPIGKYRLATIQEGKGVKAHLILPVPMGEKGRRNDIMLRLKGASSVTTPSSYAAHSSRDTREVWETGTVLFSDVLGEKLSDPSQMPTFVLAADNGGGKYGLNPTLVRLDDIAFRVKAQKGGYPYLSGVNMSFARAVFTDNVLMYSSQQNLDLKSPSEDGHYSAGFVGPRVWCDPEQNFSNLFVKTAFRYGFIFSEHANGNNLSAWNCDNAFVMSYMDHSAWFGRLHAQNCANNLIALDKEFCAHRVGPSYFEIGQMGIEINTGQEPLDFNYRNFVRDPNNYLHGSLAYHIVLSNVGAENSLFKAEGGANLKARPVYN